MKTMSAFLDSDNGSFIHETEKEPEGWHVGTRSERAYSPGRRRAPVVRIILPSAPGPLRGDEDVRERFAELADEWERETLLVSSTHEAVLHRAYQSIIGLGPQAIPHILRRLTRSPRQWFWALQHITGASPADDNTSPAEAAAAWLQWGRDNGLVDR